jgi:hypothetical protein
MEQVAAGWGVMRVDVRTTVCASVDRELIGQVVGSR